MQYTNKQILDAYDRHRIMFGIYWVSLHSFRRRLALWWSLYDATYTKKLTSMEVSQRGNEQRKLNKIAIEAKKEVDNERAAMRKETIVITTYEQPKPSVGKKIFWIDIIDFIFLIIVIAFLFFAIA